MMSHIPTATIGVALALAVATGNASSQNFPNRPVQLMVALPAGRRPTSGRASSPQSPKSRSVNRSSW